MHKFRTAIYTAIFDSIHHLIGNITINGDCHAEILKSYMQDRFLL